MNHNDWSFAWAAIIIGFVVLRGLFAFLRSLGKRAPGTQMDRINAAAKRVLEEKQSAVPASQAKSGIGTATKAKQRPIRTHATAHKAKKPLASRTTLATRSTPAVVRTGPLSAKEPVIQRRR